MTKCAVAPNGKLIVGTLESLIAQADIEVDSFSKDENGELEFDYTGNSDVSWDTQETYCEGDERIFVDEGGETWKESEIKLVDPEEVM